jgi:hypothetical protein
MKCQIIRPPAKEACGEKAAFVVTFIDKDKAYACQECALHIEQTARQNNAPLHVKVLS